ncbi:MAG: hypothetical protein PHT07_10565 [Paludibacter sp.]|nr:hypothetical protein [Paludibacter sp.]
MISKKVKKGMTILQTAYRCNAIDYPRVDNNFVTAQRYDLFPHPPMRRLVPQMGPVKREKYEVNKNNAILFLSLIRSIKPSGVHSISEMIDEYFNDDLTFRTPKHEQIYSAISNEFEAYMQEEQLTIAELMRMPKKFYSDASDAEAAGLLFFATKDYLFIRPPENIGIASPSRGASLLKTMTMWDYASKTKDEREKKAENNDPTPVSYKPLSFDEIKDGLSRFKEAYFEKVKLYRLQQKLAQTATHTGEMLKHIEAETRRLNESQISAGS